MAFPNTKDVTVTAISDTVYFVSILNNGIGAILGTCVATGNSFGISNITLEEVREVYYSTNPKEITHIRVSEEEINFIKTGITKEGFKNALNSLLN